MMVYYGPYMEFEPFEWVQEVTMKVKTTASGKMIKETDSFYEKFNFHPETGEKLVEKQHTFKNTHQIDSWGCLHYAFFSNSAVEQSFSLDFDQPVIAPAHFLPPHSAALFEATDNPMRFEFKPEAVKKVLKDFEDFFSKEIAIIREVVEIEIKYGIITDC